MTDSTKSSLIGTNPHVPDVHPFS